MEKSIDKEQTQEKKKKPFTSPPPEDEKKKEIYKEKNREQRPFMQVDKSGDLLSNFFSNFMRQFKNPTGSGLGKLLSKLLGSKIKKNENEALKPTDLIGAPKTVFRHVNVAPGTGEAANQNKSQGQRTSQSNAATIRPEQDKQQEVNKPRKPKLGM